MITRILILFFVIFGFSVEGRAWNDKDLPPPTTIPPKEDTKVKDKQTPPNSFPYAIATDVNSNSTLLNNNSLSTNKSTNTNTEVETRVRKVNPVENQTEQTPSSKTLDSQTKETQTNTLKSEVDKQKETNNKLNIPESSTNSNVNILDTNSSTTIPSPKPTDTEVPDMLEGSVIIYNKTNVAKPILNINDVNVPDKMVEPIENNPDETEDIFGIDHPVPEENTAVVQGQLAAVLAGVFVVIAIIGYIGLISWRKYLENRYRDRQMLVDDMEFNEREDTRYFTI